MAIDKRVLFFLRLTSGADNSPVIVNVEQIRAIYKHWEDNKSVIDYSGTSDGYVIVNESVDDIVKMMQK